MIYLVIRYGHLGSAVAHDFIEAIYRDKLDAQAHLSRLLSGPSGGAKFRIDERHLQ